MARDRGSSTGAASGAAGAQRLAERKDVDVAAAAAAATSSSYLAVKRAVSSEYSAIRNQAFELLANFDQDS